MTSEDTRIHGKNAVSLAAIMDYVMSGERHPLHAQATQQGVEFIAAEFVTPASKTETIHGEVGYDIARIIAGLFLPYYHPAYQGAVDRAKAFVEAERKRRLEEGRKAMQAQYDDMDEDEFRAFQRAWVD